MNECSNIKLACGLKSYSIRLTQPNDKIDMFYRCKHILINESNDIKLVCGLKSYSITLTSPNYKTIIQLCFTDVNKHLNESSDIKLACRLKSYSIRFT